MDVAAQADADPAGAAAAWAGGYESLPCDALHGDGAFSMAAADAVVVAAVSLPANMPVERLL
jgi:hypothetical protein